MLRGLIKTCAACALSWTGVGKVIGALSGSRYLPLVIGYHQVVERSPIPYRRLNPAMLITRGTLECHLDWIGRRFRFVSLDELGALLEEGRPFDKPVAAVTFDDGYRDVYHHAFPVLKQKGIPAAFFVVTDLIDTSHTQIYDHLYLLFARTFSRSRSIREGLVQSLCRLDLWRPEMERTSRMVTDPMTAMGFVLSELPQARVHCVISALEAEAGVHIETPEELRSLTWDMLAEMHRAGMIIGSHTQTHALLTNEPLYMVREEILGSRQTLEKKLGGAVQHFAYPDGRFNRAVVDTVAASGYRFGYTTCSHRDSAHPSLTIPRMCLWENSCLDALGHFSSAIMNCHACRVFDLVTSCRLDHGSPRPRS